MKQKNIAVIFGGASSEYGVSLESSYSVIKHLNREKYHPVLIGITKQGKWFYFTGDIEKIKTDRWCNKADCIPAVLSPDRKEQGLIVMRETGTEIIPVDAVFPVLHGKNGEDGTIQGLIELAGIPIAGCSTLSSALCMDKDKAHAIAQLAGVRVPKSIVLSKADEAERAEIFAKSQGWPVFVKPLRAGSSYGITRAEMKEQLAPAIDLAFSYDNRVILEEMIHGFEVGCAVLGTDELLVGEIDEIELSGGFFNFTEKYTLKTSKIYVPARISQKKAEEIKCAAKKVYRALSCSGFARVDLFLTPEGEIVFNEVNTIPGFTEHSRYPGMMKAAGYSFEEIIDKIISQAVNCRNGGNDAAE